MATFKELLSNYRPGPVKIGTFPMLGGDIYSRVLMGDEFETLNGKARERAKRAGFEETSPETWLLVRQMLVASALCDAKGERLLSDSEEDLDLVGAMTANLWAPIMSGVMAANGTSDTSVKEAAKN